MILPFSLIASLFGSEKDIKICLVMVVQDQDTLIRECFRSVEGLVDAVCIVDTGSVDWTYYVAEEFIENSKLPGIVRRYDKQMGMPQEAVLKIAHKLIKEVNFSLQDTYFLLLDADMTIKLGPKFQKNALDGDCYLILQQSSSLNFSIYGANLLRASLPWACTDPIVTRWTSRVASVPQKLHNVLIEGGNTTVERNIERLKVALMEDPENSRYLFYLAQSYKASEEYEEAIGWYWKRIEKGGDREELWFSTFMVGSCYQELGQWDQALHWYLEAYEMSPDRPGPMHKIATRYRLSGQNDLAYLFAKHGSRITRPLDQSITYYPPLRDYEFEEEISITAYYTQFKEDGYVAASDLLLRENAPSWIKDQNERNLFYYDIILKNTKFKSIDIKLPLIEQGNEERFHPMNSSIVKTDSGYKMICRAVNYTQTGGKAFHTIDQNGIFRTKNFLLHLDRNFKVLTQQEIIENLPREKFPALNVEGLEDGRLFEWNGSDWFTCTTTDTNPTGSRQISLCKLSNDRSHHTVHVEQLIPLPGPDPYRGEKNWLPLIHEGQLWMIYAYNPLTVLMPHLQTGECKPCLTYEYLLDFSRLRGSAAPIPFGDGYLALVHEVVLYPDYTRAYLHRFIFLDPQLRIEKISRPFVFIKQGIESCCGMTIDHAGNELVLSIAIEQREVQLCTLPTETVRALLHPLPKTERNPFNTSVN
jgi:tetratricopeptide (TPR) repeat protein